MLEARYDEWRKKLPGNIAWRKKKKDLKSDVIFFFKCQMDNLKLLWAFPKLLAL